MNLLAGAAVALLAVLHVYVLVLEMFLWQRPRGRAAFGMDEATARLTAPLAANQGLYNGFLAAGLAWGVVADAPARFSVRMFFCVCVVVAGLYGAWSTRSRRILLGQFVPGAVALALVWTAG